MARCAGILVIAALSAWSTQASAEPEDALKIGEARSILREASALLPKIDKSERESAAANVAGQQARAGDLAGAVASLQTVDESGRALVAHCIAYALTTRGEWRVAMQLIHDLHESVPRAFPYIAVADQLAAIGDFEDALAVSKLIREAPNGTFPYFDVLRVICAAQWKAGDISAALHTFDETLDAAEHLEKTPELSAFSVAGWCRSLVQDLAMTGYPLAASTVVQRLEMMTAEERDPGRKSQLLGFLAPSQAMVGDFAAALQTVSQLSPGEQRDSALLSVIGEYARQGDPARARELASQVSPKLWNNSALQQFAYALGTSGDVTGALETLDKVEGLGDRAYGLAQLALQQAQKSDPSAALTLMLAQEAQQAAGESAQPFVPQLFAVTLGALGDFPGSVEIVNSLGDKEKTWPLWNITEWMVANGKESDALEVAHDQKGPHPRAYALLGTAAELIGQAEAASKKASGSSLK